MSCKKCQGGCSQCVCSCKSKCIPKDCSCKVLLNSDCINNITEDLTCSGILKGQTLSEVLVQLDAYICAVFDSLDNPLTLVNVGAGAEIYKGINVFGEKEIRSLVESGLITIVQSTDEITISVDETALSAFIEANQKTYDVANVGVGAEIYKDSTVVGDVTTFNLKKVNSSTLTITENTDDITIDVPSTTMIPGLYVNNLYVPSYADYLNPDNLGKGEGTLAKPFTDSYVIDTDNSVISFTSDTAIQNAIDGNPIKSYVGAGGKGTILDPTLPDKVGQTIIIQNNNGIGYAFTGDLTVYDIDVKLEEGVQIFHSPSVATHLVDMELINSSLATTISLYLSPNSAIFIEKNGFRNKGTVTPGSGFTQSKVIEITGDKGEILQTQNDAFHIANPDTYSIIDSNWDNTAGYFNDGNLTFNIGDVTLRSVTQNVYKIGGDRIIDFTDTSFVFGIIGQDVSTSAKPFRHKGGHYNRSQNCQYQFFGNQTIDMAFEVDNTCLIVMEKPLFNGTVKTLFHNISTTDKPNLTIRSSYTNDGINMSAPDYNIFDSDLALGKWDTIYMNSCFITRGTFDYTKIDMTAGNLQSSINFIGRPLDSFSQIHEDLVKRVSRANASLDLPTGSRFINTNGNPVTDPPNIGWYLDIVI